MPIPVFDVGDPAAPAWFRDTGFLCTVDPDGPSVATLQRWADELAVLDAASGVLHYDEVTAGGRARARSEHFVEAHGGLGGFLTVGTVPATAGTLLGEPAVLYKEKCNYKLAGGAGYSPHQDAPAYRFVDRHVSAMVAIDDATVDNGCLEVVRGAHDRIWPQDDRGCIAADVVAGMVWESAEVPAGGTLWFHSRTPHRSGPNRSTRDRRALFPTYNAAREGDRRADYYRRKHEELVAAGALDRAVSLIGDFEGELAR